MLLNTKCESKSETEKLLRQAMDDYESKKFISFNFSCCFNVPYYVCINAGCRSENSW